MDACVHVYRQLHFFIILDKNNTTVHKATKQHLQLDIFKIHVCTKNTDFGHIFSVTQFSLNQPYNSCIVSILHTMFNF